MNFLETLQFLLDTILQTIFSGINQRGWSDLNNFLKSFSTTIQKLFSINF